MAGCYLAAGLQAPGLSSEGTDLQSRVPSSLRAHGPWEPGQLSLGPRPPSLSPCCPSSPIEASSAGPQLVTPGGRFHWVVFPVWPWDSAGGSAYSSAISSLLSSEGALTPSCPPGLARTGCQGRALSSSACGCPGAFTHSEGRQAGAAAPSKEPQFLNRFHMALKLTRGPPFLTSY